LNKIYRSVIPYLILIVEPALCNFIIATNDCIQRAVKAHEENGQLKLFLPFLKIETPVGHPPNGGVREAKNGCQCLVINPEKFAARVVAFVRVADSTETFSATACVIALSRFSVEIITQVSFHGSKFFERVNVPWTRGFYAPE
jgi:hypothetical protein